MREIEAGSFAVSISGSTNASIPMPHLSAPLGLVKQDGTGLMSA